VKILDKVATVPSSFGNTSDTYAPIYIAVVAAAGDWVPVECADKTEAKRVFNAVRGLSTYRGGQFELKRRGLVIYIRVAARVTTPLVLAK
jgi:hypothetical protein